MTLRGRLTLTFLVLVALLLAAFSVVVYTLNARFRQSDFRTRLKDKAHNTAKLLLEIDEVDANLLRIIDRNNLNSLYKEQVTVYDDRLTLLYDSDDKPERHSVPTSILRQVLTGDIFEFTIANSEAVALLYPHQGHNFIVIASAYDINGIAKLNNLRQILIIGNVVSLAVIGILGLLFSGRAIRPLATMLGKIDQISANNLNQRLPVRGQRDELDRLAQAFNRMLDRLQQSFDLQKQFVSQASHELRTPLTSIKGQIDVELIKERSAVEYQHTLRSLSEDIGDLTHLVNSLLELTLSNQDEATQEKTAIELDVVLFEAYDQLRTHFPNYEIAMDLPEESVPFTLAGNASLLRSALLNLLDNACKYASNGTASLRLHRVGNQAIISLSNTGLPLTHEEQRLIFQPFYRGKNTGKKKGAGIGLALAQRVVALHQGAISVDSVNGRTTFTVNVPLSQ